MSNIQIIQILFTILILVTILFFYLLHLARKQIEEKQKYSIYHVGKKQWTGSYYYKIYDFFINMALTKRFLHKVRKQFEILMPGDTKQIAIKTTKTILLSWIIDVVIIALLFVRRPSFYNGILSLTFLYFINNQIIYVSLNKNEIKLLKQLDQFLGNLRHAYQEHGMVEEALYDAIEHAGYPVKLHLSKIHKLLTEEDMEEEVDKYNEIVPNRFLKFFLSICAIMIKYGDKNLEKQSLFLTNLKYLRQEIHIEIESRERINFLFSGLIFITIMPILFLKPIQSWAISCFAGLKDYYYGAFGLITMVFIFVMTIISYHIVQELKENPNVEVKKYVLLNYITKNPIINQYLEMILNKNYGKTLRLQKLLKRVGESITPKQFLLKRYLYSIAAFLICILISFSIHKGKRDQLLNNTDNLTYVNSMLSEKQIIDMKKAVVDYTRRYKNQPISVEEVEANLLEDGVIKSKQLASMTADEIVYRIQAYGRDYYKWYELLISLIIGVMAYYIPYFQLLLVKKIRQMVMDDEVIQFQTIILMIMFFERITVEIILEWMENFANIFKKSIQDCINNLQSGEMEALEELKQKEPYEPFTNIIHKLQDSDKIGIEKAFDDIAIERFHYQEKRKLENEIFTSNRINYATIMAWMPFITTIGVYLIIPFMIEGFTQLITYLNQMKDL